MAPPLFMATRPPLTILGGLAAASIIIYTGVYTLPAILCALGLTLTNLSQNLLNEWRDYAIDRLEKPWKPFPSHPELLKKGLTIHIVTMIIAIFLIAYGIFLYPTLFAIKFAVVCLVSAYVYNLWGKRLGFWGNKFLLGAYGACLALMIEVTGSFWVLIFLPVGFAFFTLSFNLAVQWQDAVGDRKGGGKTAGTELGEKSLGLSFLAGSIAVAAFSLTPIPLMSKAMFIATSALVILSVVTKQSKFIEWGCRRLGRVALILSFILLMFRL